MWEKAYEYEIPVLARVSPDGTEVCVIFRTISGFQVYTFFYIFFFNIKEIDTFYYAAPKSSVKFRLLLRFM